MSREWTERDCQKLWLAANLKEGKNEADPEKPGKMGYMQRWVREIWEWANGIIEGNGIWKSEGVARRFKTVLSLSLSLYIYIYIYTVYGKLHPFLLRFWRHSAFVRISCVEFQQNRTIISWRWGYKSIYALGLCMIFMAPIFAKLPITQLMLSTVPNFIESGRK